MASGAVLLVFSTARHGNQAGGHFALSPMHGSPNRGLRCPANGHLLSSHPHSYPSHEPSNHAESACPCSCEARAEEQNLCHFATIDKRDDSTARQMINEQSMDSWAIAETVMAGHCPTDMCHYLPPVVKTKQQSFLGFFPERKSPAGSPA